MSMTTRATLSAACVTALGAVLAATPVQASPAEYVALGDSFSAGTGTFARADGCYRSPLGYPALVAQAQGLALDYQACSGAETSDVLADQLDTLDGGTAYVSMTIGGNDVGFAGVITQCALPGWISDCDGAVDDSLEVLRTELPDRLDTVYAEIGDRAPNAQVAVAGYPLLFNGRDCSLLTFFSGREMTRLNAGTAELDELIEERATGAGFSYVEVRDDFAGHAVCDRPAWVNNLSLPIDESFHPNRAGNQGYAAALAPQLTGAQLTATELAGAAEAGTGSPSATDGSTGSKGAGVREQARTVLTMDLASEQNLRRAQRQGVDRDRVEGAVAKLRSADERVVLSGLRELHTLDAQFSAGG